MDAEELLSDQPLPRRSMDWIKEIMSAKELPPLIKASELEQIQFTTTGIEELDKAIKGFPVGRVTEIYGLEGVGKTSLTLQSIAGMQKKGKKVLFIDVENALNSGWAKQFGVNLDTLMVSNEVTVEGIANTILAYVKQFDTIVIDSLAAMIPTAEYEGDPGEVHMGLKARQMGQMMRKVIKPLADSKCTLIFINQQRESLIPFTAKYFTPGGHAVPYATSLRIELRSLRSADKIESTEGGIKSRSGQWVTARVVKSKVGKPFVEAKFKLLY